MRLFYAVNFDEKTRSGLAGIQDRIRPLSHGGNWTREENFHLTLHYVGETDPSELLRFEKALDQAAEGMSPFALEFTGFGAFRQRKHHLIYVGAYSSKGSASSGTVPLLAKRIRQILQTGDMKPVKPHITLVRKAGMTGETLDKLIKEEPRLPPAAVSSVQLMESRMIKGMLTYTTLYDVKLDHQES